MATNTNSITIRPVVIDTILSISLTSDELRRLLDGLMSVRKPLRQTIWHGSDGLEEDKTNHQQLIDKLEAKLEEYLVSNP